MKILCVYSFRDVRLTAIFTKFNNIKHLKHLFINIHFSMYIKSIKIFILIHIAKFQQNCSSTLPITQQKKSIFPTFKWHGLLNLIGFCHYALLQKSHFLRVLSLSIAIFYLKICLIQREDARQVIEHPNLGINVGSRHFVQDGD